MRPEWMEVCGSYPIFVSLASHNVLTVFKVPNLPWAVITCCSYDVLSLMETKTTNASFMSIDLFDSLHARIDIIIGSWHPWVRPCIFLWEGCILALYWWCISSFGSLLSLILIFKFFRSLFFCVLYFLGYFVHSLLDLFFLKFKQSLFFHCRLKFLFYLFNSLFIGVKHLLDFLNVIGDGDFLSIDSVLMSFVEVSLFPEKFPGRLCLIGNNLGFSEFLFHFFNFITKAFVFVINISY